MKLFRDFTQYQNDIVFSLKTRLSSIESQPKKVVVVGGGGGAVVVIIIGHRNLTFKFGQNRVNDKRYIAVVVDPEI